jgi:uncharacterized protein YdiU (UPF0061 family)
MATIPFDNSYTSLPERFYSKQPPRPVRAPALIRANLSLAEYLGLSPELLQGPGAAEWVAGNRVPEGADPAAMAYAGHQFGHFNPQLGDGRALLLGEMVARDGVRHDLHLKGSGVTPFSRGGDGRSPLGPVLREYIVSEAMAALGVPTTRALAAASTGEPVLRERPLPGGVLLRVARSHVRVGTFEYFAARGDESGLRLLLDHVISRHYPECADAPVPALAVLGAVAQRQAELVARWQLLGFIHGVMNTDNMLVSGETIDYGPCAFMDAYDPRTLFSSIDEGGRYAYGNQPPIARWNLACLARALLPMIGPERDAIEGAQQVIDDFPAQHEQAYRKGLASKLGLSTTEPGDAELGDALLQAMHDGGADFTLTFRHLADVVDREADPAATVAALYAPPAGVRAWIGRWRQRLERDPRVAAERAAEMRRASPALIPRNHLVEEALRDAEDGGDFGRFHALVEVLGRPHDYDSTLAEFARPPRPEQRVFRTFCGT